MIVPAMSAIRKERRPKWHRKTPASERAMQSSRANSGNDVYVQEHVALQNKWKDGTRTADFQTLAGWGHGSCERPAQAIEPQTGDSRK